MVHEGNHGGRREPRTVFTCQKNESALSIGRFTDECERTSNVVVASSRNLVSKLIVCMTSKSFDQFLVRCCSQPRLRSILVVIGEVVYHVMAPIALYLIELRLHMSCVGCVLVGIFGIVLAKVSAVVGSFDRLPGQV